MNQNLHPISDTEYEILEFLKCHTSCLWSEVLNAFDPATKINKIHRHLLDFLDFGWIEKLYPAESPPQCRIRITRKGLRVLSQHLTTIPVESSCPDSTCDSGKKDIPAKKNRLDKLKKFFSVLLTVIAILASLATILTFVFQLFGVL